MYSFLTLEQKIELVSGVGKHKNTIQLAEKYKVSKRTINSWKNKAKLELIEQNIDVSMTYDAIKPPKIEEVLSIVSDEQKLITRLQTENKRLKKAIDEAKIEIVSSDDIKELISGVMDIGFDTEVPKWIKQTNPGELIPVIGLSDIHIGEEVKANEMGYGEDYNTEIAHQYSTDVICDFINICKVNMNTYNYPGIVLLLGGDGLTGALHDLAETNDRTPVQQVVELTNLYIKAINMLRQEFDKVVVFAVTGNHGRFDARNHTKTKGRVHSSLETIVYQFCTQHFSTDDSIHFVTSLSDELLFSINNRKFNLQHGDTIKGGNGIGGIHVPIMRSRAKKLSVAVANDKTFDTLIIGHFHQHFVSDDLIIMNSLKPYDEYSKLMNFSYTQPGATTFFVNTSGDIIFSTDLKIRNVKKEKKQGIVLL